MLRSSPHYWDCSHLNLILVYLNVPLRLVPTLRAPPSAILGASCSYELYTNPRLWRLDRSLWLTAMESTSVATGQPCTGYYGTQGQDRQELGLWEA